MKPLGKAWSWVGGVVTVAGYIVNHQADITAIPGNTSKAVVAIAGGVLAVAGIAMTLLGHSVVASPDQTSGS